MTLTQYLDLAYAVVVDEHVRRGDSLFDALESTGLYAAGNKGVSPATASGRDRPKAAPKAPVASYGVGGPGEPATATDLANRDAMAILTGRMASVDGGFG